MNTFIVQPIIVRSDRFPAHEVYEAVNLVRCGLMDWWFWYTLSIKAPVNVLIRDPLIRHMPPPDGGWGNQVAGNLFAQMQARLAISEWDYCDTILMLLEDLRGVDTPGAGLQWWEAVPGKNIGLALVDSTVCRALMGENSMGVDGYPPNLACGAIQHEIGHTMGKGHTRTLRDDIMFEWYRYPNVLLES